MLSIFNFCNNRQMFIINTYTVKHTLYRGLNRLQMYVREIKEKQIFKRIRWQLRIFESVFYKSLIRACSIGNWYVMTFVNSKLTEITTNFYFIVSEDIQKEFRFLFYCFWRYPERVPMYQFPALATLIYVDWLPTGQWSAANSSCLPHVDHRYYCANRVSS